MLRGMTVSPVSRPNSSGSRSMSSWWDPDRAWHTAMLKEVGAVAASSRLQPLPMVMRDRGELEGVCSAITKERVDAVFVSETVTLAARAQLLTFAATRQLPTLFGNREYVTAGGLMSYGVNFSEMFQQAAMYVDKIFKGAKPTDLPVEQPTKFELVIKMKTPKAPGLTIPPSVPARADEVIE